MSLYGLMRQWPRKFNESQTWFNGEEFMDKPAPNDNELRPADLVVSQTSPPDSHEAEHYPNAVTLAAHFLRFPEHVMWEHYLWTSDTDRFGQRVYVGVNHGKFEIHRHLHLNARWAIPKWA